MADALEAARREEPPGSLPSGVGPEDLPAGRARSCRAPGHEALRIPPGRGHLHFARVDGATAVVRAEAASPLQILPSRGRGPTARVFLVSHGGGLVAGDDVAVELEVGRAASALVTTQAETKVYHAREGRGAAQRLDARIGAGGALAYLPDPVSPFAASRYEQRLRFSLAPGASLLAVDAVVAGRTARGERWALDRYRSAIEVLLDGRRALSDALVLTNPAPGARRPRRSLADRLGRFEAFAVAIALGPVFAHGAAGLIAQLGADPVERGAAVLAAASPLAGGAFLRCAGESVEALTTFLRRALAFAAAPLGDDPFARRW